MKRFRCLILVGIVSLIGFGWFATIHFDRSVLSLATKEVEIGTCGSGECNFFWEDRNRLLVFRHSSNPNFDGSVRAIEYDLSLHKSSHLTALEALLGRRASGMGIDLWQLSPDGKSLLWDSHSTGYGAWEWARLDGSKHRIWPAISEEIHRTPHTLWTPDSNAWIELNEAVHEARILEHRTDRRDVILSTQDFMPYFYHHLGFIAPNRAIGITPRVGDGDVTVVEYDVNRAPRQRSIFFLKTPIEHGVEHNAALSPKGDRIAWRFGSTNGPFGLRVPPGASAYYRPVPREFSLWVSGTRGEGMRSLGSVKASSDALGILRWTPDGRRVSFYNDGAIWTAPAD